MTNPDRSRFPITINISNRHFHCTKETFQKLFGKPEPVKSRDVMQPGQFACEEQITIRGPKGELKKVRMIGPLRAYDQVEVSRTDCFTLGITPPVRDSGNLKGSAPITMVGPAGEVVLAEGAVVAARHVHMHTSDALKFGVKNLEYAQVKLGSAPRDGTLTVLCRVHETMKLECHVDTDEANAFDIKNGDTVTML